jgi:hypothetical protein
VSTLTIGDRMRASRVCRLPWHLDRIAHGVGRTEAETLAGTAQTTSSVLMICTLTAPIEEAEVPAIARFAWSGLQIGAQ